MTIQVMQENGFVIVVIRVCFKDNIELLQEAIKYLKKHSKN